MFSMSEYTEIGFVIYSEIASKFQQKKVKY